MLSGLALVVIPFQQLFRVCVDVMDEKKSFPSGSLYRPLEGRQDSGIDLYRQTVVPLCLTRSSFGSTAARMPTNVLFRGCVLWTAQPLAVLGIVGARLQFLEHSLLEITLSH
jgi:hypothetical protein